MSGTHTQQGREERPGDTVGQISSRDPEAVGRALARWLAGRLPPGAEPEVTDVGSNSANGMSSETVLFTARWGDEPARRLVARLAPDPGDVPVFESYDMVTQAATIREVGRCSDVPVPEVLWDEPSPAALGVPFFVMGHVDGVIPPDVMPYTFGDCWLADATDAERARLQDGMVRVLADLHAIDEPRRRFPALAAAAACSRDGRSGASALERRVGTARAWYAFATREGVRSPLVERSFAWLDAHWPAHEGPTVLSWGDSRIGNVIFRDFEPVAVLDWEMAALGPAELDVGWLTYMHAMFQEFAETFGLPGLPGFLRRDDVVAAYEARTGHTCHDLDWYEVFAAVQLAIVFLRVGARQVRFGEIALPDNIDDLLRHREGLEAMLTNGTR